MTAEDASGTDSTTCPIGGLQPFPRNSNEKNSDGHAQPRSQGLFPILNAGPALKIGKRPWERGWAMLDDRNYITIIPRARVGYEVIN